MKRFWRAAKWLGFYGLFIGVSVFGLTSGNEGAYNAAHFWGAVWGVMGIFYLFDGVTKGMKWDGRSVPRWVFVLTNMAIVTLFVWAGSFWTASLLLVGAVARDSALADLELRAKLEEII